MKVAVRISLLAILSLVFLPTLATAQAPAPKGKLVYQDDFSDGVKSQLEDNLRATDFSRGFHPPGVYHLIMRQNDQTRWKLLPNQSYRNFSAQMEVVDNSDTFNGDVSAGLVFRAEDDTHLYVALIDARKQQVAVRKLEGQAWSDLIAWKPAPMINAQGGENILRVDGDGDTFTVYVNGETLGSFKDAAYSQGGIGMVQSNVDAVNPHSHFDNLEVYTTDAPGAAVPNTLPSTGQAGESVSLALAAFAFALLLLGVWVRTARN